MFQGEFDSRTQEATAIYFLKLVKAAADNCSTEVFEKAVDLAGSSHLLISGVYTHTSTQSQRISS